VPLRARRFKALADKVFTFICKDFSKGDCISLTFNTLQTLKLAFLRTSAYMYLPLQKPVYLGNIESFVFSPVFICKFGIHCQLHCSIQKISLPESHPDHQVGLWSYGLKPCGCSPQALSRKMQKRSQYKPDSFFFILFEKLPALLL